MVEKTFINRQSRGKRRNSAGGRFAVLASLNEAVFHARDIANLWNIHNTNTLYTTLSRYVRAGLIHRIQKGLYSMQQIDDLDPYVLGLKALHAPAYVSCESVLFDSGLINQPPKEITLMSSVSKRFTVAGKRFRSRKLRDTFLLNDAGIEIRNGARVATAPRAMADMLYVNPKMYIDAFSSTAIDWESVRNVAGRVGYSIRFPKAV